MARKSRPKNKLGKPARRATTVPTSPISFRMPARLRARLRRFARDRNLGESEALRLVVTERLDAIDDDRELAEAERWQLQQATEAWERAMRGEEPTVPWERIDQIFAEARARRAAREQHK